jgi:hypothetical protein
MFARPSAWSDNWFAWRCREQFPPQLLAAALPEFSSAPQRTLVRWSYLILGRGTQQAIPIRQWLLAHSMRQIESRLSPHLQPID